MLKRLIKGAKTIDEKDSFLSDLNNHKRLAQEARKYYNLEGIAKVKLDEVENLATLSFDFAEDILLP